MLRNLVLPVVFAILVNGKPNLAQDMESLWSGARQGNFDSVKKAIESGTDVNSKTDYGATALSFAADRGHVEIVQYLISQKANPNVKDRFYGATPMDWASSHGHYEIMKVLVKGGASNISPAFTKSITKNDIDFVKDLADNRFVTYRTAKSNLHLANRRAFQAAVEILEPLVKKLEPAVSVSEDDARKYSGSYRLDANTRIKISRQDKFLTAGIGNGKPLELDAIDAQTFKGLNFEIRFEIKDDKVTGIHWLAGGQKQFLKKLTQPELDALAKQGTAPPEPPANDLQLTESSPKSRKEDLAISSRNWPQFRGTGARGIADGQDPPLKWNFKEQQNVAWSTPVPGLGHS